MRAGAWLLVAACLVALAAGRDLADLNEQPATEDLVSEELFSEEQPETMLLVDESSDGSLRVTGMLQNFRLEGGFEQENAALDRPRSSFLDLAWSSWVDERLEVFDLLQALLAPRPACPHMQAAAGSLDSGMVSYLASSRFGPAILTTYAQSFLDEAEDDGEEEWDYDSVRLPEGGLPGAKSYEEATLLEELTADADAAFAREAAGRGQAERPDLGFFGANLRAQPQLWLDGDAESLQPSVRPLPAAFAEADASLDPAGFFLEKLRGSQEEFQPVLDQEAAGRQVAGLVLFLVLLCSCTFVWLSLIRSCCRMGCELRERQSAEDAAARKLAQKELLVPLAPESAAPLPAVESAAGQAPAGNYFAPSPAGYTTVAVPLLRA